jgi:hypothetical protein
MKISQKLPSEFEIKPIEFHSFVTGLCQRNKYSLSQIGNADNCSSFRHASQLYHKFQGEKQMTMKTTGSEKLHVTVMLCITTNGNKLLPYVILNKDSAKRKFFAKM